MLQEMSNLKQPSLAGRAVLALLLMVGFYALAQGASVLGTALAVALIRQGWLLRAEPGERVTLEQGGVVVAPFSLFDELEQKKTTGDEWRRLCAGAGISDLNLAAMTDEGARKS